jgi:hypothetical protein
MSDELHNEINMNDPTHKRCVDEGVLEFPPYWILGVVWILGMLVGLINFLAEANMKNQQEAEKNKDKKTK